MIDNYNLFLVYLRAGLGVNFIESKPFQIYNEDLKAYQEFVEFQTNEWRLISTPYDQGNTGSLKVTLQFTPSGNNEEGNVLTLERVDKIVTRTISELSRESDLKLAYLGTRPNLRIPGMFSLDICLKDTDFMFHENSIMEYKDSTFLK